MNNAAPPLQQIPLVSFLGLYTEATPTDVPEGASPLNWDVDFLIGSVQMRPGIGSAFTFGGNTTGPDNCQSGSNVSLGLVPWSNPGNITHGDSNYATVALASANSAGPNLATVGTNFNTTVPWTNPGNVGSAISFATVTVLSGGSNSSTALLATGFGFSIPLNSTILGLQVTFNGKQSNGLNSGFPGVEFIIGTIKNGSLIGVNKNVGSIPTTTTPYTLGSSSDLWGVNSGWLPSDINQSNFGFHFAVFNPSGNASTFSINDVQVTVFYSVPSSDELLASNFGFAVASLSVQGISVGITGHQAGTGTITAQLSKNGVLVGNVKTATLTAGDSRIVLGGATDNWGAGLLFSDVNNPNFGVAITAAGTGTFSIDLVDCSISQTAGAQNFNWVKTYSQRDGQITTLALDNKGTIWDENVNSSPGVLNSLFTGVFPNQFAKSITLDDVEYIALSDLNAGVDQPRQWNGANLDRVSQVGPGAAPVVNFTSNGVALTALTQPASFTLPGVQNGTWVVWSSGPGSTTPGNILTFVFPSTFTLPAGIVNGAYIAIQNLPTMNGFNANSGAGSNPATYQIFNVGGPIQGQSAYTGFSVLLLQTGFFSARVSGGTVTLQLSLATATAASQVPNVQVGSQFMISGVTPSGWNGTWTCLATPNAGQYQITNTVLSSNVATFSYTLVSGSNPVAGQTVQITGCVNGNGIFNGSFVVVTANPSQFTVALNAPNVGSAGESGEAIVNGTIFQFDPQKIIGNGTVFGTISTTGAIGAGARACVVIFLTRNGALTQTSPYVQFSTTGSANALVVSNIPIGPADVIARVVAFTGAQVTQVPGQIGNFFWIPEPVTVFDPLAGQNTTYTATIIHDNTTTQATFSFTDAVLLAATPIDVQGNNLFEQKELGPCLGCISAFSRMFYWGELNKITNFVNMSFDGGAGINSAAGGVSGGGFATYPLGWTPSDTFGEVIPNSIFGNSYYILQAGAGSPIGKITQGAFQDQYGVNILNPQTTYSVRITARTPSSATVGNLVIDLFSPSFNRVYGSATFPLSSMSSSFAVFSSALLTVPFTVAVQSDLQIRLYAQNFTNGEDVEVDRIEVYPTNEPILTTQIQASYVNNFEAFDQVQGVIDASIQNQQPVRAAFTLYDTLYFVKTGSFISTQDNGSTEPSGWTTRMVSNSVGTPSVNGVDFVDNQNQGESYAIIAGRSGVYLFNGGEPVCISGEIRSLWNLINWTYGNTLWVRNDQVNRRILVGVPLPTPNQWLPNAPTNANPTTPNVVLAMSYREVNTVTELMDRGAVRTSFAGKLIAPDISRKWTIWQIQAPYGDFILRQNQAAPLFLGNSKGTGKIYQITEGRTDDDGAAINESYTTFAFPGAELEQAFQLTSTRKQFSYMTMNITGNGSLGIKVIPDNLNSPYANTLLPVTLPNLGGFDTEVPLNETGARLFVQLSMNAVGQSFNLSMLNLALMKETYTPVRGR